MKLTKTFAMALAASTAVACSDPSGPGGGPTTPISFDLCGAASLGWFAYQNEGGPWTRITPTIEGRLEFDATERVSIAIAASFFSSSITQVINATAAELQLATAVPCEGLFGDQTMNGSVAGVAGDEVVRISAATSATLADAFTPQWWLEELPAEPVDIIATRYPTFFSQPATRVVVRRGVIPSNGAVSTLDFNHQVESGDLETAIATFTNVPPNAFLGLTSAVITQNGTVHELGELGQAPVTTSSSAMISYASLPSALRSTSDNHRLMASASNAQGTWEIVHYYKTPGARTFEFGPLVSAPAFSNVASTPYVRPRAQVASQAEYPDAIFLEMSSSSGTHSVGVLTTKGFLGGTPATWDITVPDMTSAGYEPEFGLQTTDYDWWVTAFSGNALALVSESPTEVTTQASSRASAEAQIANARAAARVALLRSRFIPLPASRPKR